MNFRNLVFISFIIFIGCNQSGNTLSEEFLAEGDFTERSIQESEITETKENVVKPSGTVSKKIIKDGEMGIEVSDLNSAKTNIDSLVAKYNAYYANERLSNTSNASIFYLKIRIPSNSFESFIANIESGGYEIDYKNISARDVTEEFIDLETRLNNKRNYLKKYNELLKQAKSIAEILEIEERIRNIEEEIESAEGRLKYLSNQVSFSTLNLNVTQIKEFQFQPNKQINFFQKLKQSISNGWHAFILFILFLVKLWPFWILLGTIIFFLKRRKIKKMDNK